MTLSFATPTAGTIQGNVTQKTRLSDGQVWTYGWDHRNQLSWAERRTSGNVLQTRAEYRYDAWGNRVEKKVDWNGDALWDITQRYVLDGWNTAKGEAVGNENWDVYLDLDGSNGLETRYLRGDVVDELFARVDQVTPPKAYWTLLDHQGSVRDVLDEGGALKASARYDGYGNVTERTTGVGDPLPEEDFGYLGRYGWTGRERDAETGLQHNRARYYDPRTGRWLSLDPLGFAAGDANLYRYVGNAPTMGTDPSGKIVIFVHGIYDDGYEWGDRVYAVMQYEWQEQKKDNQIGLQYRWYGENGKPSVFDAFSETTSVRKKKTTREAVKELKDFVADLRKILPGDEPINIIAHSMGTMITLTAIEDGMVIENAVLLASPLDIHSGRTTLDKALLNVRGRITHYWTPYDKVVNVINGSTFNPGNYNRGIIVPNGPYKPAKTAGSFVQTNMFLRAATHVSFVHPEEKLNNLPVSRLMKLYGSDVAWETKRKTLSKDDVFQAKLATLLGEYIDARTLTLRTYKFKPEPKK